MMSSGLATAPAVDVWALEDDGEFDELPTLHEALEEVWVAAPRGVRSGETTKTGDGTDPPANVKDDDSIAAEFQLLAEELEAAASGVSSTRRLMGHPAYSEILALGNDAIPLLLDRLRTGRNRPTWLTLLGSLTVLPPSAGKDTIDEAAETWLRWHKHDLRLFEALTRSHSRNG
jgi:hypothetical protein